jgi:hypothetical protein
MTGVSLPVPFSICRRGSDGGPTDELLAVGMVLPDGGALTVDWRHRRPGEVRFWPSPEQAIAAHGATPGPDPEGDARIATVVWWSPAPARPNRPPTNRPSRW